MSSRFVHLMDNVSLQYVLGPQNVARKNARVSTSTATATTPPATRETPVAMLSRVRGLERRLRHRGHPRERTVRRRLVVLRTESPCERRKTGVSRLANGIKGVQRRLVFSSRASTRSRAHDAYQLDGFDRSERFASLLVDASSFVRTHRRRWRHLRNTKREKKSK